MLFPWCGLSYFTFPGSFSLCPWRALLDSVESQNLRVWSHWAPSLTTESHKKHFMVSKFTGSSFIYGFSSAVIFFLIYICFHFKIKNPTNSPLALVNNWICGEGNAVRAFCEVLGMQSQEPRSFPRGEVLHNVCTALLLHQESPGFPLEVN